MSNRLRVVFCVSLVLSCRFISAQAPCSPDAFAPADQDPVTIASEVVLPAGCTLDFGDREVDIRGSIIAVDFTLIAGRLRVLVGGEIQGGNGATTIILNAGAKQVGSAEILGAVTNDGDHGGDLLIVAQDSVTLGGSGKISAVALTPSGRAGTIDIEAAGLVMLGDTPGGSAIAARGGEAAEFGGLVSVLSTGNTVRISREIQVTGGTLLSGRAIIAAHTDIVVSAAIRAAGHCAAGSCGRAGFVQITAGGSIDLAAVDASGADGGTYSGDGTGGHIALDAGEKISIGADMNVSGGDLSDGGSFEARATAAFVITQGHVIDSSGRSDGSSGGSIGITSEGAVELDGGLRAAGGVNADAGTLQIAADGDVLVMAALEAPGNYPTGGIEILSNFGAIHVATSITANGVGLYGTGGLIGLYAATGIDLVRARLDATGSGENGLGGTVRLSSFQALDSMGGTGIRANGDADEPTLGEGGVVDLSACQVSFAASGVIEAIGAVGGNVGVTASDGLSLLSTKVLAQTDGLITLRYPPGGSPDLTGSSFSPDPLLESTSLVGPCPLPPPPSGGSFKRGDCNGSQVFDISDPISLLNFLFLGSGTAPSCEKACDSNDDGVMDISDASFALGYLFLGQRTPPAPFEQCGTDPTDDGLKCDAFAPCQVP